MSVEAMCEIATAARARARWSVSTRDIENDVDLLSAEIESDPSAALHYPEPYANGYVAFDDISGESLEVDKVREAHREGIAYFKSMKVYEKVPTSEAWSTTGQAPIAVQWVDISKGDSRKPLHRSWPVAQEFKTDIRPDTFAATPPSECLKLMLSRLAGKGRGYKLLYADVSLAYFYARAIRPVYVKLPAEAQEAGDEDRCGRLLMSMYGTRDAAQNWAG